MSCELAVAGLGYWGPNLLRTFNSTADCRVSWCCDLDPNKLAQAKRRYPDIQITTEFEDIISNPKVDAVILSVPTQLHYAFAKKALVAGKDVLLEKPMASTSRQARELASLAEFNKRVLMVDHVLLFHPAILKVKELIDQGELGEVLYIDTARTNLGIFRKDINVIFDLASHDFAVIQYLLDRTPKEIRVTGKTHVGSQLDVAYITAQYPENILAHIHVTWLSPLKLRRMLVVGNKKMIVFDDNDPSEKIKVYDKGVVGEMDDGSLKPEIGLRFGNVVSPHLETTDSLSNLAQSFIESVLTREVVRSGADFSAKIVEILENATKEYYRSQKSKKVCDENTPTKNIF